MIITNGIQVINPSSNYYIKWASGGASASENKIKTK